VFEVLEALAYIVIGIAEWRTSLPMIASFGAVVGIVFAVQIRLPLGFSLFQLASAC